MLGGSFSAGFIVEPDGADGGCQGIELLAHRLHGTSKPVANRCELGLQHKQIQTNEIKSDPPGELLLGNFHDGYDLILRRKKSCFDADLVKAAE